MTIFDVEKLENVLIFMTKCGVKHLNGVKVSCLLFLVDREHVQRYGIPVFFRRYLKTEIGPVPVLRGRVNLNDVLDFLDLARGMKVDLGVFSISEFEVLDDVFYQFRESKAEQVLDEICRLPEYRTKRIGEFITLKEMAGNMRDYVEMWEEVKESFYAQVCCSAKRDCRKIVEVDVNGRQSQNSK